MDAQTNGQLVEQMDGGMHGQMDGQMNRQTDDGMDGQMIATVSAVRDGCHFGSTPRDGNRL